MKSKSKGNIGEEKAVAFLKEKGYKVVTRNFYSRYGEIDIITFKDETFCFVEVKSGEGFEPVYNITPSKLKKFIKTVNIYLKKEKITSPYRIDAIIVTDTIDHLKNITM